MRMPKLKSLAREHIYAREDILEWEKLSWLLF